MPNEPQSAVGKVAKSEEDQMFEMIHTIMDAIVTTQVETSTTILKMSMKISALEARIVALETENAPV